MLFCVVTLCTAEVEPLGTLSTSNKRSYCDRHGYDFILHSDTLDPTRPPAWSKIPLLLDHLDRYDWLFWTDADSLIMNPAMPLSSLAGPAAAGGADLVISRDHNGVNTGSFLVSNASGRARPFLEAVYAQTQFIDHRLWEQAAMTHVIDRRLAPVSVAYVPKKAINSETSDYTEGDFILHFLGQQARVYLMRKYLGRLPRTGAAPGGPPPAVGAEVAEAYRHQQAGRLAEAGQACREAMRRAPDDPAALHLAGLLAHEAGRFDEAFDLVCRSIDLAPHVPDFHQNLGGLLAKAGRHDEAIAPLREALRLRPDQPKALYNLGAALRKGRRAAQAIHALRAAVRLRPDYAEAHREIANALADLGRVDEAVPHYRRALQLRPERSDVHSDLLLTLNAHPGLMPQALFEEHRAWAERHARPLCPPAGGGAAAHGNDRTPDRRLRVGYVSPEFRSHPVATFIAPVLANHDRGAVEVYCYSDARHEDRTTERLRTLADAWRDARGLSDEQLDGQVRADSIDILVDLAGHTGRNRLLAFARKPAPVQVTYLGYPNTTGLAAVDYRITDALADPPGGDTDACHSERLERLPGCAWCYEPPADFPPVGLPPAKRRGGAVTFASFNRLIKVTPAAVDLWAELLQRVGGGSRLLLLAGAAGDGVGGTGQAFAERGVDPTRLEILPAQPRAAFSRLFADVDLALDTFPYNGTTTTCDALWMGVPVVTLAGDRHAARVGVSLLSAVGLGSELVAATPRQYVDLAAALAGDLPRLAALRAGLRERFARSPLADGPGLARRLEDAYRLMWRRWCGTAPRHGGESSVPPFDSP